jgi:hypothetical protein
MLPFGPLWKSSHHIATVWTKGTSGPLELEFDGYMAI